MTTGNREITGRVVDLAARARRVDVGVAVRVAEQGALDVLDPALGRRLAALGRPRNGLAPAPRGSGVATYVLVLGGALACVAWLPPRDESWDGTWLLPLTPTAVLAGVVSAVVAAAWGPFSRWVRGTAAENRMRVPRSSALFWSVWFGAGVVVTTGRALADGSPGAPVLVGLALQVAAVGVLLRTWWTSRRTVPLWEPAELTRDQRALLRSLDRAYREAVLVGARDGIAGLVGCGRLTDEHAARAEELLRQRWGG